MPATAARMVEHVARERLSARPGEGPVGRRQADRVELFLGPPPDRHRLVGDVSMTSGTSGTGRRRVLARMKALRSAIMLSFRGGGGAGYNGGAGGGR